MVYRARIGACLLALMTGGCVAAYNGETQPITIASEPEGATCDVMRDGVRIARVPVTPMKVSVPRSDKPIEVQCGKNGYEQGGSAAVPGTSIALIGDFYILPLFYDLSSATNSTKYYTDTITVKLFPKTGSDKDDKK